MKDDIILAVDKKLKKVGCVLLQAAMGGSSAAVGMIDVDKWLLAPTDNLELYTIPANRWDEFMKWIDE